jgi:hypothetical protein
MWIKLIERVKGIERGALSYWVWVTQEKKQLWREGERD